MFIVTIIVDVFIILNSYSVHLEIVVFIIKYSLYKIILFNTTVQFHWYEVYKMRQEKIS